MFTGRFWSYACGSCRKLRAVSIVGHCGWPIPQVLSVVKDKQEALLLSFPKTNISHEDTSRTSLNVHSFRSRQPVGAMYTHQRHTSMFICPGYNYHGYCSWSPASIMETHQRHTGVFNLLGHEDQVMTLRHIPQETYSKIIKKVAKHVKDKPVRLILIVAKIMWWHEAHSGICTV